MGRASKTITAVFGALLGLASIAAYANVVYNWKTLDTSKALEAVSGQLIISDAAWKVGSATFNNHTDPGVYIGDATDSYPDNAIISFNLTLNKKGLDVFPRTEGIVEDADFRYALTFPHDDTIDGHLFANNTETEVEMTSDNGIWSIIKAGSDDLWAIGNACYHDVNVCTAKGQWLVDPSTVPVPEPGNLALLGFGLALIGVGLRRQR